MKPTEEIFARISDNGSNMIKGWEELSVNLYTSHPRLVPKFDKDRGIVGYFNSSVVGYNEEGVGLHACQKLSVRNAKVADGFKNNRLSLEDWCINNQSVALLTPLANDSQYLEGKNFLTPNIVIPSMY